MFYISYIYRPSFILYFCLRKTTECRLYWRISLSYTLATGDVPRIIAMTETSTSVNYRPAAFDLYQTAQTRLGRSLLPIIL
jgi:hypothetical protein